MQGQETTVASPVYLGVDVSKARLDLSGAKGPCCGFTNDRNGIIQLICAVRAHGTAQVLVEATGRLHHPMWRALDTAAIMVTVINPGRARSFARSEGKLAKTDALDAASLARFGAATAPAATPWPGEAVMEIRELEAAHRTLVADRGRLATQLQGATATLVRRQITARIKLADRQISALEAALDDRIAAEPELARRRKILTSIPGIGATTARALIAGLGELGSLGPKPIAALAGVAPMNRDSGLMRGQRHISGRRAALRATLYMAALAASRFNSDLRTFYRRLTEGGKPPKLALTAVMRKLLTLANALIRENRLWTAARP